MVMSEAASSDSAGAAKVATPEVHLALPATPEFVRLVRVTATGLASRAGFSIDDVEDLRLAIDELCFTLIGSKGREGLLQLRYRLDGTALEVHGSVDCGDHDVPHLSDWSDQILDALVDEHEVGPSSGASGTGCGFRMLKRAG